MYDPDEMITKENWKEFSQDHMFAGYGLYLKANEDILPRMGKILKTTNSFEEMKAELTRLYAERKEFVAFANKNLPK